MYRIPDIDAEYCFVRSIDGDYAVQVRYSDGELVILTDDLTYPGGIGWAASWEAVPAEEVPENVRRELEYAVDGYVDYVLARG
jgi:uncharacterized circularly permuted ATP-grasp superfamily protein